MQKIIQKILAFRDARDWKQFHKPKDLAMAIGIESGELMELFLWKSEDEIRAFLKGKSNEVADEIADIMIFSLLLCEGLGLDPNKIIENKLKKNHKKYPVHKAKGRATKYNKL